MPNLPSAADVADAARVIAAVARRTPLLSFAVLDELTGARVLIKPECLQRTGSFKFRGAYNRLSRLTEEQKPGGVVAVSSGNHAQGVATAAQLLGMPAAVLMPSDSPVSKRERTIAAGAEVVSFDRARDDRFSRVLALAEERSAVFVSPYDDFHIIAGQGTVGLEIAEDVEAMGAGLDAVLICCGGGGLTAGCALAIHDRMPSAEIFTVEPEGFDDHARSFAAGRRLSNDRLSGSICDGLLSPMPGELTFPINREHVTRGLVVSDEEARRAVAYAFAELKLVVEPSGAAALAALLSGKLDVRGKTVSVVITGGNVDPGPFAGYVA